MKTHEHISDLQPHEVSRFRAGFIADVKDRAFNVDAAVTMADGKLTTIDPASVEYALALTALVTEENETMRRNFAYLMRFISEIRPPRGRGRMATATVPEKFNGKWPHQRLGHRNWSEFVKAPTTGEIDPETRTFRSPPGLGWVPQYESNLSKGYERIRALVAGALPDATPEAIERRVDEVTQGAGPRTTETLGWMPEVTARSNLEPTDAAAAVDALAAGDVTADDVRERGAEALVAPRPKGTKAKASPIEQVKALVLTLSEADVYAFKAWFGSYLQERATGATSGPTASSESNQESGNP